MKKQILILTLIFIFVTSISAVAWSGEFYGGGGYYGKTSFTYKENRTKLQISLYDPDEYLKSQDITPDFSDVESCDIIISQANKSDNGIFAFTLSDQNNKENPYPQITSLRIYLEREQSSGFQYPIGENYRLYRLEEDNTFIKIDITESTKHHVDFNIDEFGTYVLYFEPARYDVIFYTDAEIYDDVDDDAPCDEVYYEDKGLLLSDIISYPEELPQKEGYVFAGWINWNFMGPPWKFCGPLPLTTTASGIWLNALWYPEDEYEPLQLTLSSKETIIKGKEDGCVLTLTTSDGYFSDSYCDEEGNVPPEYFLSTETVGKEDAEIYYNLVGSDELLFKSVKRIDEQTLELTLDGNSTNTKKNTDIKVEINHSMLYSSVTQIDEYGFMRDKLISDNTITLKKQSTPVSDGGGASPTVYYSINFDSNGGSEVETQKIVAYTYAKEPQDPTKDGYTFAGWYSDDTLTTAYRFDSIVKGNITLYAAWKANEKDIKKDNTTEENNTFILTVGKNTATVWGEEKTTDVAPVIRNDRAMLPARFVAENLGAEVNWDESGIVTITKDDTTIIITIGSDKAIVNGEEKILDSPAFIENDRTYTPIRFIGENLGANVDWNKENQEIIITKN